MELSPLARERLARIGELTDEEKAGLKYSEQLNSLMAEFFTSELSPDDLWQELRKHKDEGRGFVLRDVQLRILAAMRLRSSDADIDRLCRGLLAAETLKDDGDYAGLEHDLKSIEELRRQYKEERDKTYSKIKADVEQEVRLAARRLSEQAAARGATIDVRGSVEASAKARPEWKSFISRHDGTYEQRFRERVALIRERLSV